MSQNHSRFTRLGFTLIELLVVISIIAIILAILLPSLSGARQKGQSVTCLTHLSQLGQGWHMYADDFDDVAVPGRYGDAGGGTSNPANMYELGNGLKYRPRWIAMMGRYVGIDAFDAPEQKDKQDYTSKVYQCPIVPTYVDRAQPRVRL